MPAQFPYMILLVYTSELVDFMEKIRNIVKHKRISTLSLNLNNSNI